MQSIADWLSELGLQEYASIFVDNGVDVGVLPYLTEADLNHLGVLLGHRRKILRAIAQLAEKPEEGRPAITAALHHDGAERRYITLLFCDLVGSTALAAELDPEDVRSVISTYQATCSHILASYDGFVARFMGDGILAYLGYPRAHEDDAERAIRAGLDIIAAMAYLETRPAVRLQVRIAIASGPVVVGKIGGIGDAQEATGDAPNLAARLLAVANPDTIVIADSTRTQTRDLFDYEDLGPIRVKGYRHPVRAWRVSGESRVRDRFAALRGDMTGPIIGRDEEVELLLRRWRQARQGRGRVVLISGEAGIGKSRLLDALQHRLRRDKHAQATLFCAPHYQSSILHPVINYFEDAAGLSRHGGPNEMVAKLLAFMQPAGISGENAALVADLLSLPTGAFPEVNLSPQRKKEKTFEVLSNYIEWLARSSPTLLLVEDIHWSDPTTLEFLELTINKVLTLPVLLVISFRSDFNVPWIGRAGVSMMTLNRLERSDAIDLVKQLSKGTPPPGALIERIVVESDGVPLFIEELTKTVLENDALGGRHPSDVEFPDLTIPTTLQASLMARLDRLPLGKEIAQIGSVIGREFSHGLLSMVAETPDSLLLQALNQLVLSGVISCRGTPPDAIYRFKHALVQDAVYESLLRARRRALHERIVQAIFDHLPDVAERDPGLIGHHCAQAGLIEKAASYYRRAGEWSAKRAALAETQAHVERGLSLLRRLPDSTDRRILEAELKLALGRVLLSIRGSADIDAGKIFGEAVELCRGLGHSELFIRAVWGYWFNFAHRRNLSIAEELAGELVSLGQQQCDKLVSTVAHAMIGITRFWQGRFADARANLEISAELFDAGECQELDLAIVSNNLVNHVRTQLALSMTCLGYLDEAAAQAERAAKRALVRAHLPSHAIILAAKCRHDWFVGNDRIMCETATALIKLSEEQGFPFYLALARCHLGWLAVKEGRTHEGLTLLRVGLAGLQTTDAAVWQPYLRGMMAEAEAWAGNIDEAQDLLDSALTLTVETGGRWFEAELHRRKGAVLLKHVQPRQQSAEQCFRTAIAIAQSQSAKLWELRASNCLARLWSLQGRGNEALALLAPIHAWFAEGYEVPDAKEAAVLMKELTA